MATKTIRAWAAVLDNSNDVLVTIEYTGEGKITTLTSAAIRAINQSAGVAIRKYTTASFKAWGKTDWSHETGQPFHRCTVTYSMS